MGFREEEATGEGQRECIFVGVNWMKRKHI